MAKVYQYKKPTFKTVNVQDVISDDSINVRIGGKTNLYGVEGAKDGYDLPTMMAQIMEAGKILRPLTLWQRSDKTLVVLKGNRRVRAGQAILNDKSMEVSEDLRKELMQVPAEVYTDLTPEEVIDIVNDHDTKELGRAELMLNVWKLSAAGYSEKKIGNMLLYQLAEYTGNKKKLNELPTNPKDRETAIFKWLHGTLGNFLLGGYSMGPRVQKAMLETALVEDGLLKESDAKEGQPKRPEFRCKAPQIQDLSKARTQDRNANQWDENKKTGPAFEAKLAAIISEQNGGGGQPRRDRPSMDQLETLKGNSLSSLAKACYSNAGGTPTAGTLELDQQAHRAEQLMNLITVSLPEIQDEKLKDCLHKVLMYNPENFKAYLDSLKVKTK
jgi:hypothetical protein